jgi:hypothetical protein
MMEAGSLGISKNTRTSKRWTIEKVMWPGNRRLMGEARLTAGSGAFRGVELAGLIKYRPLE